MVTAGAVAVGGSCREAASDVRGYWWRLLNHIGFSVRVYLLHR